MKHAYLSEATIEDALKHNQITMQEADKLRKKIDCQTSIYELTSK